MNLTKLAATTAISLTLVLTTGTAFSQEKKQNWRAKLDLT